ncbi:MAG: ATP phosphoribosyltransferase [Candidatus Burarchaeum sp.]|nr:ATP phosphoribosyltransferase [Candidatus Burarchaeum sp.]MDO8339187.1 ATP phosphoribosyltransferase [Candidatus Burarchaeum sp.]
MEEKFRLVIPNKGVLYEPTLRLLESAGVSVGRNGNGGLFSKSKDGKLSILFARAQDVPLYVETGAADAGITGEDMVYEKGKRVKVVSNLGYGKCRVSIAVPKSSRITSVSQLAGKRIATKLPNIAREYFEKEGLKVELLELAGATELAPNIGLADAIVDHVSTGATLEANNLRELSTILESEACLISRPEAAKKPELQELQIAFEGVLRAKSSRYLMLNAASDEILRNVLSCLPSMESPTVLKLARAGEYAVHSVVKAEELGVLVPKLKRAGAKDILVLAMERVIL